MKKGFVEIGHERSDEMRTKHLRFGPTITRVLVQHKRLTKTPLAEICSNFFC